VKECRGIVLEKDSWKLISKPFLRFFNLGENLEETQAFDWTDFSCTSKEDGSLIIVYHYDGEWHVNTSGSFGLGEVQFSDKTWRELFWGTANIDQDLLFESYSYIFELCTPFNKVVRQYPESKVFLLSVFHGVDEFSPEFVDGVAANLGVPRPEIFEFQSREEITKFLCEKEETDPTYEGVVLRDSNNLRVKVKSRSYIAMHHLHDNGNIFNPKRLVPLVLAGEVDEVVAIFPEVKEAIETVRDRLDVEFENLLAVWKDCWQIENQKEFALSILSRTKFTGILFNLRKDQKDQQTEESLKFAWRQSDEAIVKILYG
jgi:hypothetical protein